MPTLKVFPAIALIAALVACGGPEDGPPPGPAPTPSPGPGPSPTPATITVRGRAVSLEGLPVIGLTAVISGHPGVNVDSEGEFAIADVRTPYELILVNGAIQHATVYRGLTRPDPTLVIAEAQPISPNRATVNGTVTGGHYPQGAAEDSWAAFVSPQVRSITRVDGTGSVGTFALPVEWSGAPSVAGRVHALQFSWQGELPAAFTAYGSASVTLSPGGSFTPSIAVAPITSGSITGNVTLPGAYSVQSKQFAIHLDGARALAFDDASQASSFSYVVPNVTAAEFSALVVAQDPNGNAIAHTSAPVRAGGSIQLAPRAAPALILPANGALNVGPSMTFSWSAFSGGIHHVVFVQEGRFRLDLFTSGDTTTLPDLSALGLSVPRAAQLGWAVAGIAPVATVDEAASPAFADRLMLWSGQETFYGVSNSRSFTTAP